MKRTSRHHCGPILLGVLVLSLFTKLGAEPDGTYFLNSGDPSKCEIYINGNPTNHGAFAGLFVRQGVNQIELRGLATGEDFAFELWKAAGISDPNARNILSTEYHLPDSQNSRLYRFKTNEWNENNWERAEKLSELSADDVETIYKIADSILGMLADNNFSPADLFSKPNTIPWRNDPDRTAKVIEWARDWQKKIDAQSELVFHKATREQTEILPGDQLVMLRATTGKLLYKGPPDDTSDTKFSWSMDAAFFCKIDGRWKFLLMN